MIFSCLRVIFIRAEILKSIPHSWAVSNTKMTVCVYSPCIYILQCCQQFCMSCPCVVSPCFEKYFHLDTNNWEILRFLRIRCQSGCDIVKKVRERWKEGVFCMFLDILILLHLTETRLIEMSKVGLDSRQK